MSFPPLDYADIQGNVLQGYRLPFAAYVDLRITRAEEGVGLLRELIGAVTDARPWGGDKPDHTLNLALSYKGLELLNVPGQALATFPKEFADGMAKRAERLGDVGDSAPDGWEDELRDIRLLAVIHAGSEEHREERLRWLEKLADGHGVPAVVLEVAGGEERQREHFGFADGFGQPGVDGQTGPDYPGQGVATVGRSWTRVRTRRGWRLIAPGEFILGCIDEDKLPSHAPAPPYGANGTFMVFRKLRQDVVAFRELVQELADAHFDGNVGLTAANIAGRWRDGTPLMLSPEAEDPALADDKWRMNDFHYADDRQGRRCPLGSHVRRANPRDGLFGDGKRTRRHRIIRRGMSYGPVLPEGHADDGTARGLIFTCFNASIVRQFETVNTWLLSGKPFGLDHGDLLTDSTGEPAMTIQGDPPLILESAKPRPRRKPRPLVTTCGGEYLFLPSKAALAELAELAELAGEGGRR